MVVNVIGRTHDWSMPACTALLKQALRDCEHSTQCVANRMQQLQVVYRVRDACQICRAVKMLGFIPAHASMLEQAVTIPTRCSSKGSIMALNFVHKLMSDLESCQDARDLCNSHPKRRELHVHLRGMDKGHVHSFDAGSTREHVQAYEHAPTHVKMGDCYSARNTREQGMCPHGWRNLQNGSVNAFVLEYASASMQEM